MLRIFIADASRDLVVLRLDGRIGGRWVELLRKTCEVPLNAGARVTVDLMNVSFSDRDGITLLRHLKERQVEFLNISPFIACEIEIPPSSGSKG